MEIDNNYLIAVVIPCYKVENQIKKVVEELPDWISSVILVDDASPDKTGKIIDTLASTSSKITALHHDENQGVGGVMVTGFKEALRQKQDIVIKIDGDGQMDTSYFKEMVNSLMHQDYDFVKGNRFFDRKMLQQMPAVRRIGNIGMGFLIRMASGYWNVFDPTNGFIGIRSSILERIDFKRLSKRFFFESSLLIELYYVGAKIKDIPMPAIYAQEKSNLSIWKTLFSFPPKLFKAFIRRIWLRYFICDFNIGSLYIFFGLPLFLFGLIFGIAKWIHYGQLHLPTPTGTVMIAVISLVLGFQMILAATQYDITAKNPFAQKNDNY